MIWGHFQTLGGLYLEARRLSLLYLLSVRPVPSMIDFPGQFVEKKYTAGLLAKSSIKSDVMKTAGLSPQRSCLSMHSLSKTGVFPSYGGTYRAHIKPRLPVSKPHTARVLQEPTDPDP